MPSFSQARGGIASTILYPLNITIRPPSSSESSKALCVLHSGTPRLHLGPAACVFTYPPSTAVKTRHIILLAVLAHHACLLPRGTCPLPAVLARQALLQVAASLLAAPIIRLLCSSPTAWETLFHILFPKVPLPFCIVLCVFQSSLSLDRLGQAGRLLWDKPPGVSRIR